MPRQELGAFAGRVQAFFFCSGATGLVYQVLWTRRLSLTFGHTVLAISSVLAAFMGGLALGSLFSGWWTDRRIERHWSSFLRDYAILEAVIGVWALLSLPMLGLVEDLYISAASAGIRGLALYLLCFLAAILVLVPPTTAMGATLPLLARLLTDRTTALGTTLARLYGVNTLGALLGATLSGFVLLPLLGLSLSMLGTAAINLSIGWAANSLARRARLKEHGSGEAGPGEGLNPESTAKKHRQAKSEHSEGSLEDRKPLLLPVLFGVAGVGAMMYQIAWNRAICLAIGSSVYAFSTILGTVLAGLGLGSLLYPKISSRHRLRVHHLGWLFLGIAVSGGLSEALVTLLPAGFLYLFPYTGGSYGAVLLADVLLTASLLLAPTLLMGVGFPLVTALYSRATDRLGGSVGEIFSANTIGCIVGAFVTGFVLIPYIGTQWTLKLATLVYLSLALIVFLRVAERRPQELGAVFAGTILILLSPGWDKAIFSSGVAVYTEAGDHHHPAVFKDGLSATVSFHLNGENWDRPQMKVNGKVDASLGEGDQRTQYLLGYLPTLIHSAPSRVGVIGLGGGFTVEAVAQCPGVEVIDVAELEPAVVEMIEYWRAYNGGAMDDPRVELHVTDGRTFVLAHREKFDVLISEPSNPWIAGIGNLFTVDFYRRARTKLNDDGIFCQWFNLYAVSGEDLKMVLRGFYQVFPHGHLWQSTGGDLILLGSARPVDMDINRFRMAWSGSIVCQRHFFESGIYSPEVIPGHYLMSRDEALELAGEGSLNTDDKPLLEFSAPFSLYDSTALFNNLRLLRGAPASSHPPGLEIDPGAELMRLLGALNVEDLETVRERLLAHQDRSPEAFVLAAGLKAKLEPEDLDSRRGVYRGCLKKFPGKSGLAAYRWGQLEYQSGNFELAAALFREALLDPPKGSEAILNELFGQSLAKSNEHELALAPLARASVLNQTRSTALSLLGGSLLILKRNEEAVKVLEQARLRNPYDPTVHHNLAFAHFNTKSPALAEKDLLSFLALVPDHAQAWERLGACRKLLGDASGARKAFKEALDLNPESKSAYRELLELQGR